jgi:small neutral amino acid transporter SnatA (MarC family)
MRKRGFQEGRTQNMTYEKLETLAISGVVATVAIFFVAAFLGGPLMQWFHLSTTQWDRLFTIVEFVVVFLIGISLGAAFVEKK